MDIDMKNIAAKELDIVFSRTKDYYGLNFDLYRNQLLKSPLRSHIKQTLEIACSIADIALETAAKQWMLNSLSKLLRKIEAIIARLDAREITSLELARKNNIRVNEEKENKIRKERIAKETQYYKEQFEKIVAELDQFKKNLAIYLEAQKDFSERLKKNSTEMQDAINKNISLLANVEDDLFKNLTNVDSLIKEVILDNFRQYKEDISQAPDRYLQWLVENPEEADLLIQADRKAIAAKQQTLLDNIHQSPDSDVWLQSIEQAISEVLLNLDIIVAKSKENLKLTAEIQVHEAELQEKIAELDYRLSIARNYSDEYQQAEQTINDIKQGIAEILPKHDKVDKTERWVEIERKSKNTKSSNNQTANNIFSSASNTRLTDILIAEKNNTDKQDTKNNKSRSNNITSDKHSGNADNDPQRKKSKF